MKSIKLMVMIAVLSLCFAAVQPVNPAKVASKATKLATKFASVSGGVTTIISGAISVATLIIGNTQEDLVGNRILENHKSLIGRLARLDGKLERLENIASYISEIDTTAEMEVEEFVIKLAKFFDLSTKIDIFFKRYTEFSNDTVQPSDRMLSEFANSIMAHDTRSPRYMIAHIFRLLNDRHALLALSGKPEVNKYVICTRKDVSMALFMQMLLMHATILESMTLTMVSFSLDYFISTNRTEGNLREHYIDHLLEMRKRMVEFVTALKNQPKGNVGKLWTCDSSMNKISTRNALQFKLFMFTVHARLYKPRRKHCAAYLTGDTGSYSHEGPVGKVCAITAKYYEESNSCEGKLWTCSHTIGDINFCLTERTNHWDRMFAFIDVGKRGRECAKENTVSIAAHKNCIDCLCVCDAYDDPLSMRYISTEMVTVDTIHNSVVTGVRLSLEYTTLALALRQTEMNEDGTLNASTHRWISGTKDHVNRYKFTALDRRLNLNTIVGGYGYFVTGAGFQVSNDGIYLQLQITPYEQKTFRLLQPHRMVGPYNLKGNNKIYMENKQVHLENDIPSMYVFDDSFVEFTTSDFDTDSGQTTVPFFDGRAVESLTALEGLGIFYKQRTAVYAGYVAPLLIPADLSKRLTKMMPFDFDMLLPFVDIDAIANGSYSPSTTTTPMDFHSPLLLILSCISCTLLPLLWNQY